MDKRSFSPFLGVVLSLGEVKSDEAENVDAFRVVLRGGMENEEEVEDVVDVSWEEEEMTETLLALLPSAERASIKPTLLLLLPPLSLSPPPLWLMLTALPELGPLPFFFMADCREGVD